MSPKPVDKEEKRKIILDAALKVYKENGFSDSKVEDIAKKANIGKGTVYEYFRSKEEIAVKLIENSFNSQIQILKKIKIKEDPPLESLKSFISSLIEEVDLLSVIIPLHFEIWSGKKGKAMGLNKIMSERFEKLSFYFNRILNEGKTKNIFTRKI